MHKLGTLREKQAKMTITPPKELKGVVDIEKEVAGFNEDFWLISKLHQRGYSYERIRKEYNNQYSVVEISYMIQKIVNVNIALSTSDGDRSRQQMLDELMAQKQMLFASAAIDSTTGELSFNKDQHKILLNIQDRIIQLQGIQAPIKIETNHNVKIIDAQNKVNDLMSRYKSELKGKVVIDVTPQSQGTIADVESVVNNYLENK